jgi:hypothetical protein
MVLTETQRRPHKRVDVHTPKNGLGAKPESIATT